ncbi:hypothetical protein HKCCSP123_06625 [Rhodobacterales bacterium HKCCSP123]|nr:hypothetical protein [Rhodobacterales bacterium HKCCSP123]
MQRVRIGAGALWLAILPGLSLAQTCPQGLARDGVWIEFPDRTVMTHVLSDGRIAETEYPFDGGPVYGYITLPMGLVLESWALENGRAPAADRETVTYVGTPDPVPFPAPGVRFDGIETSVFADGGQSRYTINVTVGSGAPVTIGGCTYTGFPVDVTRIEMDGTVYRDGMMHLGELGVTIYLGFSDDGSVPVPLMPVSISMMAPMAGGASAPGTAPPPLPTPPGGTAGVPSK